MCPERSPRSPLLRPGRQLHNRAGPYSLVAKDGGDVDADSARSRRSTGRARTPMVHKPELLVQLYEVLNNWRVIHLDGRPLPEYPEPLGYTFARRNRSTRRPMCRPPTAPCCCHGTAITRRRRALGRFARRHCCWRQWPGRCSCSGGSRYPRASSHSNACLWRLYVTADLEPGATGDAPWLRRRRHGREWSGGRV